MTGGVRVFSTESGAKGVNISHSTCVVLNRKLARDSEEAGLAEEVLLVVHFAVFKGNNLLRGDLFNLFLFNRSIFVLFILLCFFLLVGILFGSFYLVFLSNVLIQGCLSDSFFNLGESSGDLEHLSSTLTITGSNNRGVDV